MVVRPEEACPGSTMFRHLQPRRLIHNVRKWAGRIQKVFTIIKHQGCSGFPFPCFRLGFAPRASSSLPLVEGSSINIRGQGVIIILEEQSKGIVGAGCLARLSNGMPGSSSIHSYNDG
jgi:hypothetical protein